MDVYDTIKEVDDIEYSGLCLLAVDKPSSTEQALKEDCWRQDMKDELESIRENNTWTMCELLAGHRAIGLKWIFKVKDSTGNVNKHKSQLVAKSYAHRQEADSDEVSTSMAWMETVCLLLELDTHGCWEVHHTDIKSAFLNIDLHEQIYVN